MKALCVKEPWASIIIFGPKRTENRTWYTAHKGPLLICASKAPEPLWAPAWDLVAQPDIRDSHPRLAELAWAKRKHRYLGHAIGIVDVVGCDFECVGVWDMPDQFHWRLKNPRPLEVPFPVTGQLGLFEVALPDQQMLQLSGKSGGFAR